MRAMRTATVPTRVLIFVLLTVAFLSAETVTAFGSNSVPSFSWSSCKTKNQKRKASSLYAAHPKDSWSHDLSQKVQSLAKSWTAIAILSSQLVPAAAVAQVMPPPLTDTTTVMVAGASGGASVGANAKITTGGASTLQSGRTIAITRGVNLDNSDFSGQNLKGVAFQQSIVRDTNFRGTNLVGASFFDATLDGSDFENADMTLANVEMAQFNRANLKDAVVREMYVSGATLFEGIQNIEGSDWTDTMLRKDQQKLLCEHPTAKGTNPTTGVETRESLMCLD